MKIFSNSDLKFQRKEAFVKLKATVIKMKKCSCTAVGVITAMTAIIGGVAADMLMSCKCGTHNRNCPQTMRQKASHAMHTLGDKLDKAADDIANN